MQTALNKVLNSNANASAETRIILDSGSQRTYISENMCTKQGLYVQNSNTLNVVTLGSPKPQKKINKHTKLCVKLKTGIFFEMSATVVPVISAELNQQPVKCPQNKDMTQLLQTVCLADTNPSKNEKSPVEMLIGNDYYLYLISATKIELRPGLYLLHTQLG